MRAISTLEQIRPVLAVALADLSLIAEDVSVTPAGRRSVLRVAVDRDLEHLDLTDETAPVPPLTLDEVAEATKSVSTALDDSDVMGARPYVLEVSSPGVERPLTLPRHFRRNVGRLVHLSMLDGSTRAGRIRAAGPEGVVLTAVPTQADSGDDALSEVPFGQIARAQVQVEFAHHAEQED